MQYLDCPFKCGPECEKNIQVHTDCKKNISTKLNMSFSIYHWITLPLSFHANGSLKIYCRGLSMVVTSLVPIALSSVGRKAEKMTFYYYNYYYYN